MVYLSGRLIGLVRVQPCGRGLLALWCHWVLDSNLISFLASLSDWLLLYLLASHKRVHLGSLQSPPTMQAAVLQTSEQCNQNVRDFYVIPPPEGVHGLVSMHSPETHWNTLTLNATLHFSTFSCPYCLLLSLRINSPFAILIPQEDKLKNKSRRRLQATNLSENDSVFSLESGPAAPRHNTNQYKQSSV